MTVTAEKTTGASFSDGQDVAGEYSIDSAHSRLGFSARHAMVTKVRGSFGEFTGEGIFDTEDPSESSVKLTIEVASITTGNEMRDTHLRSNDFLSATEFPQITFASTKVTADESLNLTVVGDLTLRGVTRSIEIPFEFNGAAIDPYGNHRIGFEGRAKVNRSDFGVTWNGALETGGLLVSEEVGLEFDISAIKKVAEVEAGAA